jgi:SAM-dependent methyltransferase
MDRTAHWEQVYRTKATDQVSWFQAEATLSLALIQKLATGHDTPIVDIGAGASVLVDGLLAAGYTDLTVLDIAEPALAIARARIGAPASAVKWIAGDVLEAALPAASAAIWHDRAVFHFLTNADDRRRYVAQAARTLRPGAHIILATFAEDGPLKCSGLEVARYSPAALQAELGEGFALVESHRELHSTPSGATQAFTFLVSRKES